MKGSVKEMYDSMKMPEDLQSRIHSAAESASAPRRRPKLRAALAAAAVLALTLCLVSPVRAAVGSLMLKFRDPETGLAVYEGENEQGEPMIAGVSETEGVPFAEVRQGRLYFTGNGENLDITEEVAGGRPYIYSYQDANGYTIYRIVGMAGTVENFGGYSFTKDAEGLWFSGEGYNYWDTETGQLYPWVDAMWQELNIPWPKPCLEE